MLKWVREFAIALGGGTVVLIGMLTVCKGLLIKFFESGIESSFEKSLERFKNKMERSTRAYEILLDREMRYYGRIDPIVAKLIVLEQDMLAYLQCVGYTKLSPKEIYDKFFEYFQDYCEQIIALKNENLIHQCYIPQKLFAAFGDVVKQMQDDMGYWTNSAKLLATGEYDAIDYFKGEEIKNTALRRIAAAEIIIEERLHQLCGEEQV